MKNLQVSFTTRTGVKKTFLVSGEKKPSQKAKNVMQKMAVAPKIAKVNYESKKQRVDTSTHATPKKSSQPTRSRTGAKPKCPPGKAARGLCEVEPEQL